MPAKKKKKMNSLLILLFIRSGLTQTSEKTEKIKLEGADLFSALLIINTTSDIIQDTNQRLSELQYIRQDNVNTPPFEVGYITYVIQEKYRKMVDKYNTSSYMRTKLYLMELVLYLEEIERHYWQIEHLANMLHEIENKYAVPYGFGSPYNDAVTKQHFSINYPTMRSTKKRKMFNMKRFWKNRNKTLYGPTKKPKHPKKMWDLDYGWEIDYYW